MLKGKNKLGLIPIIALLISYTLLYWPSRSLADKGKYLTAATLQLLKDLRKVGIPNSSIGVAATVLPTTIYPFEPINFSFNAKKKFNPASTVKLFTSYYALRVIGSSYKFKTDFFTVGKRNLDTFDGNLYIRGSGDPKLVYEDLQEIVYAIRRKGLKTLLGNFVIDD